MNGQVVCVQYPITWAFVLTVSFEPDVTAAMPQMSFAIGLFALLSQGFAKDAVCCENG